MRMIEKEESIVGEIFMKYFSKQVDSSRDAIKVLVTKDDEGRPTITHFAHQILLNELKIDTDTKEKYAMEVQNRLLGLRG